MNRHLRRTLVCVAVAAPLALAAMWARSHIGYPDTVWARLAPTRNSDVELCDVLDGPPLGTGSYAASVADDDPSVRVTTNPGFGKGELHAFLRRLGLVRGEEPPATYRFVGETKRTEKGSWQKFALAPR